MILEDRIRQSKTDEVVEKISRNSRRLKNTFEISQIFRDMLTVRHYEWAKLRFI